LEDLVRNRDRYLHTSAGRAGWARSSGICCERPIWAKRAT